MWLDHGDKARHVPGPAREPLGQLADLGAGPNELATVPGPRVAAPAVPNAAPALVRSKSTFDLVGAVASNQGGRVGRCCIDDPIGVAAVICRGPAIHGDEQVLL